MAKPEHHHAAGAEEALVMQRTVGETGGMANTIDRLVVGLRVIDVGAEIAI